MTTWHDLDGKRIVDVIGDFTDYDALIDRLRQRVAEIGLSQRVLDELTGLGDGGTQKYLTDVRIKHLSVVSLFRIASVLGVKSVMIVDPMLVRKMKPLWEERDAKRVHPKNAKRLGPKTVRRMMSIIAVEMGRRGGCAARSWPAERRRERAQRAAAARWHRTQARPLSSG
jgi:hypothetical protein